MDQIDFGDLGMTAQQAREVKATLAQWREQRRRLAQAQMQIMAREGGERKFVEDGDGGGEVAMQINPVSYHEWGQRIGYQCWDDPTFCKEYLRDVPESRVKSTGRNLTLRVSGLGAAVGKHARFKKTY